MYSLVKKTAELLNLKTADSVLHFVCHMYINNSVGPCVEIWAPVCIFW